MTTDRGSRWNPDRLAHHEHERDVLLRELRELESQHASGEMDTNRYRILADDLTTRAAAEIEAISQGQPSRLTRRTSRRGKVGLASGIVGAAVLAAVLLSDQLAPRVPPAPPAVADAEPTSRIARLAAVVDERPTDIPARTALARLLLEEQDFRGALDQFDAVAELDPSHAEALAYAGWLATLNGDATGGLQRLERAVTVNPDYADAHAFLGLNLMRSENPKGAAVELRRYLQLEPRGPLADQVRAVIERLEGTS